MFKIKTHSLQSQILKFIWQDKRPRIACNVLLRPKALGGLGVPWIAKYYYAAQVGQMALWQTVSDVPLWVSLEAYLCHPVAVNNLLWLPPKDRLGISNPITSHSLKIWDRVKFTGKLMSRGAPLLTLRGNPIFLPAFKQPGAFFHWRMKDLLRVPKLLTASGILSFATLKDRYGLPQGELFRYLQICHYLLDLQSGTP